MKEKILANRYRLTEQIGMGGMAIVYRAVDLRTGHNVAVKVLRPEYNEDSEFISRFQREAEAASKMTHHNIVNLLDVGMDGETQPRTGWADCYPHPERTGTRTPERDCPPGYQTPEYPGPCGRTYQGCGLRYCTDCKQFHTDQRR